MVLTYCMVHMHCDSSLRQSSTTALSSIKPAQAWTLSIDEGQLSIPCCQSLSSLISYRYEGQTWCMCHQESPGASETMET